MIQNHSKNIHFYSIFLRKYYVKILMTRDKNMQSYVIIFCNIEVRSKEKWE